MDMIGFFSTADEDSEENQKKLSENKTVLAGFEALNNALQTHERNTSNDAAIAQKLLREGSGL